MSPVRYELGFYIPEDDVLHSHRRDNLKPYTLSDLVKFTENLFCKATSVIFSSRQVSAKLHGKTCIRVLQTQMCQFNSSL
jgi:hypothetical protein